MRPVSPILTYVGIVVAAAGFVVIMITWGKVGALTIVPFQLPYIVSGGFVGLSLVMTGLTLISVNAKRQDASARERQLGQVREVLTEIKSLLAGEQPVAEATPAADATPVAAGQLDAEPTPASAPAPSADGEGADPTEPIPPVTV